MEKRATLLPIIILLNKNAHMKMKCLLIISLIIFGHYSNANDTVNYQMQYSNADRDWKVLEELLKPANKSGKQKLYLDESLGLEYRNKGLEFWYKYPNDPRRYDWFYFTSGFPSDSAGPKYWSNIETGATLSSEKAWYYGQIIPVNHNAIRRWELIYPKLLKEFMVSDISIKKKNTIKSIQLYSYLYHRINPSYQASAKLDLKHVQRIFKSVAEMFYGDGFEIVTGRSRNINFENAGGISDPFRIIDGTLISKYEIYGLTTKEIIYFLKPFLDSSNPHIQNWASEKTKLLSLKNKFFDFQAVSMNGESYSLSEGKGKVILLDFWSTSCGACIKAMPRLKEVYEKYKDDGFEVFSISINPKGDKKDVEKIHNKIGAKWPTFLIGGESWKDKESLGYKIWNTYNFQSVPQLFLLDKEGKLVAYNGTLHSDLEQIVKKLLK
ncbi:TlpA family protein disulfide reductase [Pedobacter ginsengisoli]|uniref:TlpA family protein disulfide reductase n=1 Tax=Pedobacter ginsengisoli TaxID=363852 RepID=UPI002549EA56|nr:TlpA disulfide reductase family protein [Pedobacter ginsengisoli]